MLRIKLLPEADNFLKELPFALLWEGLATKRQSNSCETYHK